MSLVVVVAFARQVMYSAKPLDDYMDAALTAILQVGGRPSPGPAVSAWLVVRAGCYDVLMGCWF